MLQGAGRKAQKFRNKLIRGVIPLTLLTVLSALPLAGCFEDDEGLRAGFESGRYRLVVAFGDSIVEGYRQPEGWPEMLGRELGARYDGVRVLNAGVSGNTAGDGLRRVQRDVLSHRPDLVLVSFGLNDMKNGLSVARFREDLAALLARLSAGGAQPVLLTTTRLQRGASVLARLNPGPFNEAIRSLAEEEGVPLIDVNRESGGLNKPEYLMDAAHPNGEGYKALAAIIRKGLLGE